MTAPVQSCQPSTVEYLRRASSAVYLACEEPVAADISKHLKWAADRIEYLEATEANQIATLTARNRELEARVGELEGWMLEIAEHPKSQKGNPSWGVGWAFWNIQRIAAAALLPGTPAVSR